MAKCDDLTAEFVRQILDYDPETGEFTWRYRPDYPPQWNGKWAGKIAGATDAEGRRQIKILGRFYKAHRLAFLIIAGRWPIEQIDHADHDNGNNRWGNLREANNAQNMHNRPAQMNNTSGAKGVWFEKRRCKWVAEIAVNYQHIYLGQFDNIEEASAVYERAALKYHGEFARVA